MNVSPRRALTLTALALIAAAGLPGCGGSSAPKTEQDRQNLSADSQNALQRFRNEDPSLGDRIGRAYGYAIFPDVGKGGLIAGGAYGRGEVYEQGRMVGFCDLTQATIGLQAGGQTYSQLILFEDKAAMDRFKSGKLAFSANASAVAVKSGAAAAARYSDGVLVFVMTRGGLMAEASLGGQQFTFQPVP